MKIEIYQINADRDKNNLMYRGSKTAFKAAPAVDSAIYDKVYEGDPECRDLEDVYIMFNGLLPDGYRARSLSVSDIVRVTGRPEEENGFWYCDDIGFTKVDFDPEKAQIGERFFKARDGVLRVLIVRPGKHPEAAEIEDSLEAMQETVGGCIEEYMPFDDDVAIICNEEGKLLGLPPNRGIFSGQGELMDIIMGDFFIAYAPCDSERFQSLPKKLEEKYKDMFWYPERFFRCGQNLEAVRYKPEPEPAAR